MNHYCGAQTEDRGAAARCEHCSARKRPASVGCWAKVAASCKARSMRPGPGRVGPPEVRKAIQPRDAKGEVMTCMTWNPKTSYKGLYDFERTMKIIGTSLHLLYPTCPIRWSMSLDALLVPPKDKHAERLNPNATQEEREYVYSAHSSLSVARTLALYLNRYSAKIHKIHYAKIEESSLVAVSFSQESPIPQEVGVFVGITTYCR